jgi:hypothetical protein
MGRQDAVAARRRGWRAALPGAIVLLVFVERFQVVVLIIGRVALVGVVQAGVAQGVGALFPVVGLGAIRGGRRW